MRVLVAMSGGVDSSVAAGLLVHAGHEVVGVTMKLWGGDSDTGCCSVSDVDDARRVAQQLGIDFFVFNFGDDFNRHVVDPYVASHAAGDTPNPCIECNRHLKFDRFLERATELGFDTVATGHHARVAIAPSGSLRVARGADALKDQSYVLSMLTQAELRRVVFPVGHLTKHEVRQEAATLGLRTATKPDSQDVCFITSTKGRSGFLSTRIPLTPGRLVDHQTGEQVGTVPAVQLVTIGQRKGLGLAGDDEPRYAVDVDVPNGIVSVGPAELLLTTDVRLGTLAWSDGVVEGPVVVQCSAHGAPVPATLEMAVGDDGSRQPTAVVRFAAAQRKIAPGQTVAFYDTSAPDQVVGSGIAR